MPLQAASRLIYNTCVVTSRSKSKFLAQPLWSFDRREMVRTPLRKARVIQRCHRKRLDHVSVGKPGTVLGAKSISPIFCSEYLDNFTEQLPPLVVIGLLKLALEPPDSDVVTSESGMSSFSL